MGLLAKEPETGGSDFEIIPADTYHAICYAVWDLGTHYSEYYGKSSHKVLINWELPDLRIDIEKNGETLNLPRAMSKRYTLSLHKNAALRKDLESWRGKKFTSDELQGFDLRNLLGVNCLLQVIHNKVEDKTYANVNSVSKLLSSIKSKTPENPTGFFSFADGFEIPDNCPKWVCDIIQQSNEWDAEFNPKGKGDNPDEPIIDTPYPTDDDIPF